MSHKQINLIKRWEKTGLLDSYDGSRKNIAELFESDAAVLIRDDIFFDVSIEQTISYLENNLIKARRPELQVRVAYQLIRFITSNILKKHCQ